MGGRRHGYNDLAPDCLAGSQRNLRTASKPFLVTGIDVQRRSKAEGTNETTYIDRHGAYVRVL
jgi:hypothetical protein